MSILRAGILNKEEYKDLPKSTSDLILKNPAALSNAETLDEALLDIEDFIREQTIEIQDKSKNLQTIPGEGQPGQQPKNLPGHETPPATTAGAPAPAEPNSLEDINSLSGPARSRAILRNSIRKKEGVKE